MGIDGVYLDCHYYCQPDMHEYPAPKKRYRRITCVHHHLSHHHIGPKFLVGYLLSLQPFNPGLIHVTTGGLNLNVTSACSSYYTILHLTSMHKNI